MDFGRGDHMDVYELVLFIHIGSAIVLVGGGLVATPAIRTAALRAGTVGELRLWLGFGKRFSVINPVSSLVLLGSGVYLASVGSWWSSAWVQLAIGLWIVNAALAATVVKPAMARIAKAALRSSDGPVTAELDGLRRSPRWGVTSDVLLASDVGVLYLMVSKPGYIKSLVVILLAHLVLQAGGVALRSRRRAVPVASGESATRPMAGTGTASR
jgi:uncharacterized membrane protein